MIFSFGITVGIVLNDCKLIVHYNTFHNIIIIFVSC